MELQEKGKVVLFNEHKQSLPIEKCRKILNKNGIVYTDNEIIRIKEYLYQMAAMVMDNSQQVRHNAKNYISPAA